ncbi:hypothetical protein RclHR1_00130006 [Rhizophagus clarus]|uniref:DDE-1 domain-containing protein n=1 Tax=Rhizophagus clarus TaxID=94130 RepID=A0A2Z6QAD5_9GLOM|nr:hypothetical protein RclHR1_00130006 [Rhizophagus clarus]GES76806.1 hypothetical protein RCL_jg23546.t1 [Rhizophagus clarus]
MASLDGQWWCWTYCWENLKHARLSDICGLVKRFWKNISNEIITQSFKTCEITNSDSEKDDDQESIYMKFPQDRYKTITLDDHPFFDIDFMYNDKFFF